MNYDNFMPIKLKPSIKDYLWGGTRLRSVFGKDKAGTGILSESWELSAHPSGVSVVDSGIYRGMFFPDYLSTVGNTSLGKKYNTSIPFPLLIKFIDAKRDLSIQVHPTDEYALTHEGQFGKTEFWYIVDAEPDAFIYLGFNKSISDEEIKGRINAGTLVDVLNKIPVKRGDCFLINAGLPHAIGAGCLICEIQESSDLTYRLYDYGRKDSNGNLRELHIDKALKVLYKEKYVVTEELRPYSLTTDLLSIADLCSCKYFSVRRITSRSYCTVYTGSESFFALVFLCGEPTIKFGKADMPIYPGDTCFCPANSDFSIDGSCELLSISL